MSLAHINPAGSAWTDITDLIRFPEGARHGTVLEVSRGVVDDLLAHFGDERTRGATQGGEGMGE